MSRPRHKVVVRRDRQDARYWLANVVGEAGAHTFGRSLVEAKRHALDMVALWFDVEPDTFEIDWDLRLGELARVVKRAHVAIAHVAEDQRRRDEAVRTLTDAGISYRDVGELLGLSFQRVAQIAKAS